MNRLLLGCVAAIGLSSTPSLAATPTFDETISTCSAVINEQYAAGSSLPRYGECVGAVGKYLAGIGAVSPGADPEVGELVAALALLYRHVATCDIVLTELPEAIGRAEASIYSADFKREIRNIRYQVTTCNPGGTSGSQRHQSSPS